METLINFSNHPYHSWSSDQKKCAQKYFKKIKDISYPYIEPNYNGNDLTMLKNIYLPMILESGTNFETMIHIMGELRFVYIMVNELQNLNYTCLVSINDRQVIDLGNGEFLKKFSFKGFAPYPVCNHSIQYPKTFLIT